jgi:hypothetical protein
MGQESGKGVGRRDRKKGKEEARKKEDIEEGKGRRGREFG